MWLSFIWCSHHTVCKSFNSVKNRFAFEFLISQNLAMLCQNTVHCGPVWKWRYFDWMAQVKWEGGWMNGTKQAAHAIFGEKENVVWRSTLQYDTNIEYNTARRGLRNAKRERERETLRVGEREQANDRETRSAVKH